VVEFLMIDIEDWLVEFIDVSGEYTEVINWLIDNIEDVRDKQIKGEFKGKPKPYHFSSISQFARFRGLTDKWYLEVRGNQQRKTVRFNNSVPHRQIVEFALKYLCQVK
jgi:hypothetical protein